MKQLFFFLFIFVFSYSLTAQSTPPGKYSSADEKAIKHFQNALGYYKEGKDKNAMEELDKAEKRDPTFGEVFELRADIFMDKHEYMKSIEQYKKLFSVSKHPHWQTFYTCGTMELRQGLYEDAKQHYEQFLKAPYIDPGMQDDVARGLANCNFAIEAMKHPVDFKPVNMGPNINSAAPEYFPAITVDGKKFLFTRRLTKDVGEGMVAAQEDFYASDLVDGNWSPAKPVDGINTPGNEGAPCYSANGKILFFAACKERDGTYGSPDRIGYGSCDIFYSVLVNGHWTKPENVGPPVSTAAYETQPSFSSDGKSLYFIRSQIGTDKHTLKNQDIYVSTLNDNGEFSEPKKLSDKVNTPETEQSVFIHPDNMTLYFSSNGRPGMGGLDIYMSKRQPDGEWGEAVNLGYPINTSGDDNSLMADPKGKLAYFASDRPGGFGALDLYSFELPPAFQPEKITYFKGKVYDAVSKKPLEASFDLIDLGTQKSLYTSLSERGTGEFFLTLTANKDYALNVTKPGYLFYSENFALKESLDKSKPFIMDVPLQPIDTGKSIVLKNVFFETAKFDLLPQSKAELNKLVGFLNLNKTLKIELSGHTDDVGDKKSNLLLSQNRAKAVYEYLVTNGIAKERLTHKGFGDTRPVVANDSPEHRQLNRRTEFRITGK
jgi:outer membrane protein OmpA-like peptidoglycan-associated protein